MLQGVLKKNIPHDERINANWLSVSPDSSSR